MELISKTIETLMILFKKMYANEIISLQTYYYALYYLLILGTYIIYIYNTYMRTMKLTFLQKKDICIFSLL